MPLKKPKSKLLGKAIGVASNFVPGGSLVRGAIKTGASLLGGRGGATASRKRRFSMSRLQKRLIQAKINAKIKRVQFSAFKGL